MCIYNIYSGIFKRYHLPACLPACLSVCLFVCLSVCLSVCLCGIRIHSYDHIRIGRLYVSSCNVYMWAVHVCVCVCVCMCVCMSFSRITPDECPCHTTSIFTDDFFPCVVLTHVISGSCLFTGDLMQSCKRCTLPLCHI